jgi:hypothetical protein
MQIERSKDGFGQPDTVAAAEAMKMYNMFTNLQSCAKLAVRYPFTIQLQSMKGNVCDGRYRKTS